MNMNISIGIIDMSKEHGMIIDIREHVHSMNTGMNNDHKCMQ